MGGKETAWFSKLQYFSRKYESNLAWVQPMPSSVASSGSKVLPLTGKLGKKGGKVGPKIWKVEKNQAKFGVWELIFVSKSRNLDFEKS